MEAIGACVERRSCWVYVVLIFEVPAPGEHVTTCCGTALYLVRFLLPTMERASTGGRLPPSLPLSLATAGPPPPPPVSQVGGV